MPENRQQKSQPVSTQHQKAQPSTVGELRANIANTTNLLETIANRIKRLQCQEEKVWREVTRTQKRSVRTQEAKYRRQIRSFEKSQIDQTNASERNTRLHNAMQQRIMLEASRDKIRQRIIDQQNNGVNMRYEMVKRREDLAEQRRLEYEQKQQQAQKVKMHKLRARNVVREFKDRKQSISNNHSMDDFINLQEQLRQLELDVVDAESKEMATLRKLENSRIWKEESLSDFNPTPRIGQIQNSKIKGIPFRDLSTTASSNFSATSSPVHTSCSPSPTNPVQMTKSDSSPSSWRESHKSNPKIERWASNSTVGQLGQIVEEA